MLRIERPAPPAQDKAHLDLKKATQQFESYFLNELLKEMRKTVPPDKLLADDGNGKQIFQDMMDQKLSDNMSSRGHMGLAKMIYDQLAPALGSTSPASSATTGPKPKTDLKG
ncbi:MAG: rod-binding protein [Armatimonadota bacterium]|nr:rod-binding protein [Armatimonadota bacterium]